MIGAPAGAVVLIAVIIVVIMLSKRDKRLASRHQAQIGGLR